MNGGFTGADFDEVNKEEDNGVTVANPVEVAPSDEPVNASTMNTDEAKPFDPNNIGEGVKIAPPSEDPEDLSQYSDGTSSAPKLDPTLPNATKQINTKEAVRLNAVTGEEMDMEVLRGDKTAEQVEAEKEEKLKKVEVEDYEEGSNIVSSIILIIFFIALVGFVVFLPEIQTFFQEYLGGEVKEEKEVVTGKLICELKTSTAEFDRDFTKVFMFEKKKLKSAKFTTNVIGDISEDEDKLNEISSACNKIKDAVEGLEGIEVSCTLSPNQLSQVERFDYATYDLEKTSQAYLDAESSFVEYTLDQDIDDIMVKMRQSGYDCKKEASK